MRIRLTVIVVIAVSLVALLVASCTPKVEEAQRADPEAPVDKSVSKAEPQKKAELPKPSATPKATATPEPEEELKFSDLRTPDQLDSYRVVHAMTWESENTEDSGSMEMTTEFVRNPPAQRMVMRDLKNEEEGVETIQIGGINYIKFGDEWTAVQSEDQEITEAGDFWTPDTFLGEGEGRYLGKEKINGVDTKALYINKFALLS